MLKGTVPIRGQSLDATEGLIRIVKELAPKGSVLGEQQENS